MRLAFITLDVFTTTPYAGNPLAIVFVPAEHHQALTQPQKQKLAAEFNLSETVFLHQISERPTIIDIFTPISEIPFAGHPTIGTAWYILHFQGKNVDALQTKAGRIPISMTDGGLVCAAIPHNIHIHARTFNSSLSDEAGPIVSIVKGMSFILASLPDLGALAKAKGTLYKDAYNSDILDEGWKEGLIGTLFYAPVGIDSSGNRAFRTRMHGSSEDPATGSASSALGAYLALKEPPERGSGPFRYVLTQGVEMGRKSEIVVDVTRSGPGVIESIFLSGTAIIMMQGSLEV